MEPTYEELKSELDKARDLLRKLLESSLDPYDDFVDISIYESDVAEFLGEDNKEV